MQTPIDFGKDFLNRLFDQKDADACLKMLAGDLVWITPEEMHHFLSEGAVLRFLRKQMKADSEAMYVDLISIKSSPSADNIMTVAYEINLVPREGEKPLYLRCSMVICRRSKRLEITFLHFSAKAQRDSSEQLRDFITNLPCGVMILACLDGRREEAIFYNEYFAHRLRYRQEEFARAMARNPFFMASEDDRERIHEEIAQARQSGGNIAANLRFYRKDGNSYYYRMLGAPAYQADGGTVYYCVFQETTGFQLTTDRLQGRLNTATEILRQIPEAICGIEYPAKQEQAPAAPASAADSAKAENGTKAVSDTVAWTKMPAEAADDSDVKVFQKSRGGKADSGKADGGKPSAGGKSGKISPGGSPDRGPRVFFTSKNIPGMFGVSNSAYMKNILLDPFFGLEITSITRDKIMSSRIFDTQQSGTAGPVSCGIFRLKKQDGKASEPVIREDIALGQVPEFQADFAGGQTADAGSGQTGEIRSSQTAEIMSGQTMDPAIVQADGQEKNPAADGKKVSDADGKKDPSAGHRAGRRSSGSSSSAEPHRVELVVRRVRLKNGTTRIYLFYYDREAQQRDMENRIDRAMKMGRAGQEQLRAELNRTKENGARKQSELKASLKEAEKKHEETVTRLENQLADEKKRGVLMARQLDESRAAQKQAVSELEKNREETERSIRNYQGRADRMIREAVNARTLLEEQLREAQERSRILEEQFRNEKARRLLLEEQLKEGGKSLQDMLEDAVPAGTVVTADAMAAPVPTMQSMQNAGAAASAAAAGQSAAIQSMQSMRMAGAAASPSAADSASPAVSPVQAMQKAGKTGFSGMTGPAAQLQPSLGNEPVRTDDWMNGTESLTVFSSMDPTASDSISAPVSSARSVDGGAFVTASERTFDAAFTAVSERTSDTSKSEVYATAPAAVSRIFRPMSDPGREFTPEEMTVFVEKRIRAREYDKARKRLRDLMEKADVYLQNPEAEADAHLQKPGAGSGQDSQNPQMKTEGSDFGYQISCSRENISGIMDDFLEAASTEQTLLKEKKFSPEACLQNIMIYEGMACAQKGITLRLYRDSRLPAEVTGFSSLLQRALCEILENAIANTGRGGKISVHCRADRPSGGLVNLYFRIDDNGAGISAERMQTLFETDTTADPDKPVRSGLFAAREAATLMGGSIHASSGSGRTRFTLNVVVRV